MLERISGNDGHDEKYVVIAKNGNVALGLYLKARRDHCLEGSPYTLRGRLRAAAAPGKEATAKEVNDAFKGLPFEKFAYDEGLGSGGAIFRASCTVSFFTKQQELEGLPTALAELKIGQRIYDFLLKGIDKGLMVFAPNKITEIVVAEVTTQSVEQSAGLALAQKIANTDEAFMAKVQTVCEKLIQSIETSEAEFNAAVSQAKEFADESAKVLIKAHGKKNPDFSFSVPEPDKQEFTLLSLAQYPEGDSHGFEDGHGDDDPGYDA